MSFYCNEGYQFVQNVRLLINLKKKQFVLEAQLLCS